MPWRQNRLPDKVKELIYIAVDANVTHMYLPGVRQHVRAALRLGATPHEIMEVLELSATLGIHAMNIGVPILVEVLREKGLRTGAAPLDERQQALKDEFTAARGYWHAFWDEILELDPELFAAYTEFSAVPWRTGTLEPKVKELVYIAFDTAATHLYVKGLKIHIENAIGYGATPQEILEVMEIASVLGVHAVAAATPILEEEVAMLRDQAAGAGAGTSAGETPVVPDSRPARSAGREPVAGPGGAVGEPDVGGRDAGELRRALGPVGIWTGALDTVPAAEAQDLVAELEELGFGALWLPEVTGRDVFVHLALLLSATRRLVGATGIATIWGRDAVAMSGAMRGLTEAFPHRCLFGLGVSHRNLVEDLRGHRYERPRSAMAAYLDAADAAPYTAQRPAAPVRRVLGALGPRMLALAAERADGAHSYFVTPEHTAMARGVLGPGPLLCPEQAVIFERDPGRARELGRRYTARYLAQPNYANNLRRLGFADEDLQGDGTDAVVDALVAWGDDGAVLARIAAHLDAGADHVCVQVLDPERRGVPRQQWLHLAALVVGLGR